jgi:AAA ATPase domain
MDSVRNPFNPGAGTRPPLLVGREAQLEAMRVAVLRLNAGRFERSMILTGLRGVGKTVLLTEFGAIAKQEGWIHAHLEGTDEMRVASAIAAVSRRVLLELSLGERAKERSRRALGVLRSFIKVHVPLGEAGTLTIDLDAHPGPADSGELDGDLAGLFVELGESAQHAGRGVLITLDEIQYLSERELAALIVGLHRVAQLGLPLLIVGAGLPSLPGLAGEARSYAERLFQYVSIGSLNNSDARLALTLPVESEGVQWETGALTQVVNDTGGYPYFLQEFGKQAWNLATGSMITDTVMTAAKVLAIDDLDHGFFRARIDRTTGAERTYLSAMAALGGPGPYKSGEVAKALGKSGPQMGPVRDSLIRRGLCYSPRHGELAFTVPMFDSYVRRSIS